MESSVFTLPTILAIIAIVIGIFAIVLAVLLYGKFDRIRLEVKQIAKTVVPAPAKEEMSTENFNAIVETVMVGIESKLAKMKEIELASAPAVEFKTVKTPTYINPEVEKKKLVYKYASAYDVSKKTFYKVEDRPSDETIFELAIDGENENTGTITVYKHAYKKVTEVRDFLDGACNVSGSGVNIQIDKEGIISLEGGKWRVEQPMEVKFI